MEQFHRQLAAAKADFVPVEPILSGTSIAAYAMRQMVQLAASVDRPVFISGPHGSGKIAIAHAIHNRRTNEELGLTAVDCTDVANASLDWNNALAGGSLLLCEIGQLSDRDQRTLLSHLKRENPVKLLATSISSLPLLISETGFDRQLAQHLETITIPTPPLAKRRTDIEGLLGRYWQLAPDALPPRPTKNALSALQDHHWPGNFHELANFAEHALRVFGGKQMRSCHVSQLLCSNPQGAFRAGAGTLRPSPHFDLAARIAREERLLLTEALAHSRGVVAKAAEITGMNQATFERRMRRHGLERC